MHRALYVFGTFVLMCSGAFGTAACSSGSSGGGPLGGTGGATGYGGVGGSSAAGGSSGTGATGGDAGSAGAGGGGPSGLDLPFSPSNIDIAAHEGKVLRDFVVKDYVPNSGADTMEHIRIDTNALTITYYDWPDNKDYQLSGTDFVFEAVQQTQGGPEVALLVVNSLRVTSSQTFYVKGTRPLVLVAASTIQLDGETSIDSGITQAPFSGSIGSNGFGPGGGKVGNNAMYGGGAGGGSYCSPGGKGGDDYTQPSGGLAGAAYGSPAIIPLQGGSSGACARLSSCAGHGGGAVQFVAGESITVGGYISAPGGGGCEGYEWGGSGGGSGGAILLEAPGVTLNGILAVNGGGGGGDFYPGEIGTDSGAVAPGGLGCSGNGAANTKAATAGVDDSSPTCDTPAGGGGGAGWIRINTSTGTITQGPSSVFSPAQSTSCATLGTLTP